MEQPQAASPGNDAVARQYEQFVYPEPVADLAGRVDEFDPRRIGDVCWPDGTAAARRDILVAGCGVKQAASIAYNNPACRVTGIDVSATSLAHEQRLKGRHGLDNLELRQLAIEDCAALGRDFDLIIATGVLHHLADPAVGLRRLREVLRPDGVAVIMLYGRHARVGIDMMRQMFQMLGLEHKREDFEVVRATLSAIRPDHYVRWYYEWEKILASEGVLVDTFLHRRERSYTVGDCLELLAAADMRFAGWVDNYCYYPEAHIPPGNPLFARLLALPEERMWEAMELFTGHVLQHGFLASRPQRPESAYKVWFEGDGFLDYVPIRHIDGVIQPDPAKGRPAMIRRDGPLFSPIPLDDAQARVFNQIDGVRTIRQCLDRSGIAAERDAIIQFGRNLFRSLWRAGHVRVRIAGT